MFVCLRLIRTRPVCDVTREKGRGIGTRVGRAGGLVRVASGQTDEWTRVCTTDREYCEWVTKHVPSKGERERAKGSERR